MKKIVCIMLLVMSIYSCKKDCKTCPENYVLKNDECECESGVVINEKCVPLSEFRESDGYIQEETPICDGFEGVELFEYVYAYNSGNSLVKLNLDFYGSEIRGESGVVFYHSNDSFFSAKYTDFGRLGISYRNNGGQYFEKQIDNETCYLRCHVKVLSPRHMKYYFFFANNKDEIKSDYCVRHFYQP